MQDGQGLLIGIFSRDFPDSIPITDQVKSGRRGPVYQDQLQGLGNDSSQEKLPGIQCILSVPSTSCGDRTGLQGNVG